MNTFTQSFQAPPANIIKPSVRRDLLVVGVVTLATYILSGLFELNERLASWTVPHEAYQLDELPVTILAMAVALAWFSWRRSRQAMEQVTLRLAAQQALVESEEQYRTLFMENRRLSQRSMQVQEEERRNLARELHDELGQSLNAIKVDAVTIRDRSVALPEIHRSALSIIEVSSQVYDVVRSLMQRLRPVALDELGLRSAVQYGVEQWQRRHAGVRCTFTAEGELDDLDEQTNITLYRLVQECLTNVAKHADATQVAVSMTRAANELSFSFSDNGKGFDPSQRSRGLGLVGLRERVEALAGHFELESAPGGGAHVKAVIPAKAKK